MNKFYKIAFAFLVFNLLFHFTQSKAQDKHEISIGTGMWELFNIGGHYNINNKLQTGIKIGGIPTVGLSELISITGDLTQLVQICNKAYIKSVS